MALKVWFALFCFLVWWLIFLSLFLRPTWMMIPTTQKKKRCVHITEVGDADGMVEWPIDLSEWHWPHIYPAIDAVNVVFTQKSHQGWLFIFKSVKSCLFSGTWRRNVIPRSRQYTELLVGLALRLRTANLALSKGSSTSQVHTLYLGSSTEV